MFWSLFDFTFQGAKPVDYGPGVRSLPTSCMSMALIPRNQDPCERPSAEGWCLVQACGNVAQYLGRWNWNVIPCALRFLFARICCALLSLLKNSPVLQIVSVWVLMTRNLPGFSKTPGSSCCWCDMVFYFIPGFYWTDIAGILLNTRFQLGWCSVGASTLLFFFLVNRVAPVCVNLSVCIRRWRRFFNGVTPPDREAECLVRKGVGH